MNTENLIALIYCRVSSQRQVNEGKGLDSQETRCRNHCKPKEYPVEKVFQDEGVSGGLFERPAMRQLLEHIDANPHKKYVVVFDDLKRFARDYQVHLKLKIELVKTRGVQLECLNFNFEDSPEGEFVEGVLALSGELERKQNRRQVVQKMKARLERGYWAFCPPPALINEKSAVHGKILVPKQPLASIFKQAIEGYAHNLLNTQEEVRQFILKKYEEHGINRPISDHGVERILKNPLYAGLLEYPDWEVALMDAQHEGFITKETFELVQNKMQGRSKPRSGKNYNPDFPLRQFVTCSECGKRLYASWNTSRDGTKYPNYYCSSSKDECVFSGKVSKAFDVHPEFEKFLETAKVPPSCTSTAKLVFNHFWEIKKVECENYAQQRGYKKRDIEKSIAVFANRVATASSPALISAYEKQIEVLSNDLENLGDGKPIQKKFDKKGFDICWNRVQEQLENPLLLWNSELYEDKRTVLHMYFNNGLSWHYENGFGTTKISDEIKLLQCIGTGNFQDVEMTSNDLVSATVS